MVSVEEMLGNPFWYALQTEQVRFGMGEGKARRYPAEVIRFAGVEDGGAQPMRALCGLLEPGEAIYVSGDHISEEGVAEGGMEVVRSLPGWQMRIGDEVAGEPGEGIELLDGDAAAEMVALTEVAFPGFFCARTCELGPYFGIRVDGELVAMAGARVSLPGLREISAVCTHPAHTGRGYAARLLRHVVWANRAEGIESFLHVVAANERAIEIYERLGFLKGRAVVFRQLQRISGTRADYQI